MKSKSVCRKIERAVKKYPIKFECEDVGIFVNCVAETKGGFLLGLLYDFCNSGDFVNITFEFDTDGMDDTSKLSELSEEFNRKARYSAFENAFPREIYGGGHIEAKGGVAKTVKKILDEVLGDSESAKIIKKMMKIAEQSKMA